MSLTAFTHHFADLPDPRVNRGRNHRLSDILTIALCAVIAGAEGWDDIEAFGHAKQEFLVTSLGMDLPLGIPCADTFRRLFARLDPEAFCACFRAFTQTLHTKTKGEVIALDGKVLRHSFDTALGQSALHLVSAWTSQNHLVLGAVATEDKSNEITAFPRLLRLLDLAGCIVTIDAMGCQKEIAQQIVSQGGDYVLALKDNHPHLFEDVENFFAYHQEKGWDGVDVQSCQTVEKDHGRIETRRCVLVRLEAEDIGFGDIQQDWKGLRGLALVESVRQIGEKRSKECRYFVSSLCGKAEQVLEAVRSHWGIENRLHHVLDVSFNEDASRIRRDHSAQNLATLRHLALNQIRQEKRSKGGIKARRKRAGWDDAYLLQVLVS